MPLHNFLPPNRENVGHKVFPLPDKSIRLDDPNYIHYVPTEPLFGDRFETGRKDSAASYHAPAIDDRTILRTYVSVSSFRRSQSGSLPPSSPQKSTPSPSKENDFNQSFQTSPSKKLEASNQTPPGPVVDAFSQLPTGAATRSPNSIPASLESRVIRLENSNLLENIHTNSVDDYSSADSRSHDEKADEIEKNEGTYHDYAVIPPRDRRSPQHHQHGQQEGEGRATFDEAEYEVVVGPPPSNPVTADATSELENEASTLTPPSSISEEERVQNDQAGIKKENSPPPAYFEELKQVTSSLGAAMQLKEEQQKVISKKEQEVESERQKARDDHTAEKFLKEIPKTDSNGVELGEAQRLELAKQLAETRFAEKEVELLAEFEEWKRVRDLDTEWTVRPPLNNK